MKIIPGFLAEESLYKLSNGYTLTSNKDNGVENSNVIPQKPKDFFACYGACRYFAGGHDLCEQLCS